MKINVHGPTRTQLEAVAGSKLKIVGVYSRVGTKRYHGRERETVLIRDIRDAETGVRLADHLWFNRGRIWRKTALMPGDIVSFEARAIEYRTGYWGPDPIRQLDEPPRRDFRLTPPEELRVVHRAQHRPGLAA